MASDFYWDFAMSIRNRLKDEINGVVKFEIYGGIDTIIFKIYFKEFDFKYGISEVSSIIYDGKSDELIEDILHAYKRAVLNAFFKTDNRKKRDAEIRLGINKEEFV